MTESLRRRLDKVIDTTDLTDMEVLKIFEEESNNSESIFNYIEGSDAE